MIHWFDLTQQIQAVWRGHRSRKRSLDFRQYANLKKQNDALAQSIEVCLF